MNEAAKILAEVTFIPFAEGGRVEPPDCRRTWYYPHLVIGDPDQRLAQRKGNVLTEDYLGVGFPPGSGPFEHATPRQVFLCLIDVPSLKCEALTPGTTFTLREGPKVVGFGRVIRELIREAP